MKFNILANLISFLFISVCTFVVVSILDVLNINIAESSISIIISILIILISIVVFRKYIFTFLVSKVLNYSLLVIKDRIGFACFYNNYDEAKNDIVESFRESSIAYIFIQLGRGVIGGQPSLLFDESKNRKDNNFRMKLLFSKIDSQWLSREVASERKSNFREWQASAKYNEQNISVLEEEGINIEARKHSEPYLWRLYIFDDYTYFVPYLYKRQNEKFAPVLKFIKSSESAPSLYDVFIKYFEHIWAKNRNNCVQSERDT